MPIIGRGLLGYILLVTVVSALMISSVSPGNLLSTLLLLMILLIPTSMLLVKQRLPGEHVRPLFKTGMEKVGDVEVYDLGGSYLAITTLVVKDIQRSILDFKIEDLARYSKSFTSIVSSIPGPFLVLLVRKNIDMDKYLKRLESKILHYRIIAQSDPSNPIIESKLSRLEKILDRVSKGENPVRVELVVAVYNVGGNQAKLVEDVTSRFKTLKTSLESLLGLKCTVKSLREILRDIIGENTRNQIEVLESDLAFLTPITTYKRPLLEEFGEGVYIGDDIDFKNPVFYDFERYSLRHIVVAGPTGRGKTTFLKTLVKRVSDVYPEASIWVLDFKGEFSNIKTMKVLDLSRTTINFLSTHTTTPTLKAKQFVEAVRLVSELRPSEEHMLYHYVSKLLLERGKVRVGELIEYIKGEIENESLFGNPVSSLISKIEPYLVGGNVAEEDLENLLKTSLIIDFSKLPEEQRDLYTYLILQELYNHMLKNYPEEVLRGVLVLDEAWRLLRTSVGSKLLLKLVKEGRSYGISIVLASQDFKDFPREILDNAGTIVVFGSNSKPYIEEVSDYMSLNVQEKERIMWLNVGEALVRMYGDPRPLWVKVVPEED